ncbi:MAG: hypothetical protein COA36_12640 [Desulfotalea sp.]|nr:MAG: hypothetical protein COA36_12640 [Desulfotalea sp.]
MKELIRRLRAHLRLTFDLAAASLFINILGLTSSIYSIVVLRRYLAVGLDSTLVTLTVGALLAVAFEFSLRHVRMALGRELSRQSDRELSEATFTALAQSQYAHMSRVGGEQFREAVRGLGTIQQAYSPFSVLTIFDAPFALLYLLALFIVSPLLAAITGSVIFFSLGFGFFVQKRMQIPAQNLAKESTQQGIHVSTLISAADSVRIFNWLPLLRNKWIEQQNLVENSRSSLQHYQNLAQQMGISSAMLLSILMMCLGAREVLAGHMTVATLIGGNILAGRALSCINRCSQVLDQFARASQQMKTLRTLATLPLEKEQGTVLANVSGKFQINDLGFLFQGAPLPLFESISLTLNPGQVLVVTGANGAGKTTLARLLVGLHEPQRGEVRLDDINMKQFNPVWLRKQMMYLPQEVSFFDGSLRENLTSLSPEVEEETIVKMIRKLQLGPLVEASPDGLDMPLPGGGRHLSLGIRRRLALCRALLGGGKLIILDEPTEGLDTAGCQAVSNILNEKMKENATIIIMSNAPFILEAADYVLDLNVKPVPSLKDMRMKEKPPVKALEED